MSVAWVAVGASVVGSLMQDDNGAEGANDAAAESTRMQAEIAKQQWETYKKLYMPLEEQYIAESQGIGSVANQNKNAQQAAADVTSSYAGLRERLRKNPGLNPNAQAYLQEENRINLSQAAATAAAQTGARDTTRDKGRAALTDALSLGKGLPATASSAFGSNATYNANRAANLQQQADGQAAGFGKLVGGIFESPTVKNWVNGAANSGGSAVNAPGGASFGADIGMDNADTYAGYI